MYSSAFKYPTPAKDYYTQCNNAGRQLTHQFKPINPLNSVPISITYQAAYSTISLKLSDRSKIINTPALHVTYWPISKLSRCMTKSG